MRDQILEFHLPFPRTYNWPWNCDSILLWYWPNTHHQRTKGTSKNEPKYPKYTHNTLCKRQGPFLTFSHPRQWFHSFTKMLNFFKNHTLQVVGWWWKIFIVFEIWPIKLESLISFRWQNIGSVQQEKDGSQNRKSNRQNQTSNASWSEILICHSIYVLKRDSQNRICSCWGSVQIWFEVG